MSDETNIPASMSQFATRADFDAHNKELAKNAFAKQCLEHVLDNGNKEMSDSELIASLEQQVADLKESLRYAIEEADGWCDYACGKEIKTDEMDLARERAK